MASLKRSAHRLIEVVKADECRIIGGVNEDCETLGVAYRPKFLKLQESP